jgi:hypothetical protein
MGKKYPAACAAGKNRLPKKRQPPFPSMGKRGQGMKRGMKRGIYCGI